MANERYSEFTEETPKSFVQGLFEESTTQKQRLGTVRRLSDGREFVYAQMGATNAVAGQVYQARVPVIANEANLAAANANVGDRVANVTMGDTTLANTANALAEGYLWASSGGANGHAYKIKSHPAIAANANGLITLYDKLRSSNWATTKVSLVPHPCKAVIVAVANLTAVPVGVATFVVTANSYCWLQTKGPCAVETDGTVIAGDKVVIGSANGTVMPEGVNGVAAPLGICIANNANDHWSLIDLKL
jgi:hypothetical protein